MLLNMFIELETPLQVKSELTRQRICWLKLLVPLAKQLPAASMKLNVFLFEIAIILPNLYPESIMT